MVKRNNDLSAKMAKQDKPSKRLKTSSDYQKQESKYRDFNHFWAMKAHQKKINPKWKESLRAHMKGIGCDHPDKYEQGLKNFLGE